MSNIQTTTANNQLVLPPNNTGNTPWAAEIDLLVKALNTVDAKLAIVASIQQSAYTYAADTGAANVYAVTISGEPALVAGSAVIFKAAHANTAASTLAVNGGTAIAIRKNGTSVLVGAEISAGQMVHVIYDGSAWQLISI